jgi:hypothetical protein
MKRVLVVHFSGDFRAAHRRRVADGSESYFGHGYILDQLAHLAGRHGAAAYLSCLAPAYAENIGNGVTVIGGGANPLRDPRAIRDAIAAWGPSHVVVHGPMMQLLRQVRAMDVAVGCLWADSFVLPAWRRWLRYGNLARVLNDPRITLVGNHGINAARGLAALGVDPARVVPWDFPHPAGPEAVAPRDLPAVGLHDLLYVGAHDAKKGIDDAIAAMAYLREVPARLVIVGSGGEARLAALAQRLGVADRVHFTGALANSEVQRRMRQASAVLVPSRHAFPEGLPLTLFEAIAARTPVIASDHPMFAGHAVDRQTAMVFPAGRPRVLADSIVALLSDPALYARLSAAAPRAWASMQVPARWGEVIDHWVAGDRAWLTAHSLSMMQKDPA